MKYYKTTLPNKLRVVTVPIKNMESATITLWVNVGSRYEAPKISGISHFLEHMVFKGTTRRPGAKIIAEEIDSFGGEFNAATSKEWTNFYIKTRKGKIDTAFDVLSDMVFDPLLKEEDIKREKGVIVEEIGMYEDTPMMHIGDVFDRLIYKGSSLSRDIIGTRETVSGLTQKDFINFRKKYYGGNTVLVTVSGGVTPKHVEKLAKEHLSGLHIVKEPEIVPFTPKQKAPRLLLEYKKAEQAHLILGFHAEGRGHKDRFALAVLTTILGSGMSSRLFTEVREKRGLAYSVRSGIDKYDDAGYVEAYAGVDPKRAQDAIKVILDQHYGLSDGSYPVGEKELIKAKEYMKGHLALGLEDTKAINRFIGVRELKQRSIETTDEVYKGIDAVTVDDVVRVAKRIFVTKNLNLAVIGPYKDKSVFQKVIK